MILTSIPPRLLHRVRDAAAYLYDLASLGLAILCPCGDDHGRALRELGPGDHERIDDPAELERVAAWIEANGLLEDDAPGWVEVSPGVEVLMLNRPPTFGEALAAASRSLP